jgi:hypothetical protein
MRNFYTVVLERMKRYSQDFDTEPYECGWAGEAMFFIRIHELSGKDIMLESRVQVSVDGIHWIDEGTVFPTINNGGDFFIKVSHFGGWLRLRNQVKGDNPEVRLTVHLVLKE